MGEGGSRGGLGFRRRRRNRRGRERKGCRTCIYGRGEGGFGKRKGLGRFGSRVIDLRGCWVLFCLRIGCLGGGA